MYRELLKTHTALTISLCPQPGPVCVNVPEDSYIYTPAAAIVPRSAQHDSFSLTRSEPNDRLWRMSSESEPLLPRTNRSPHTTTLPYRVTGASDVSWREIGSSAVDLIICLLQFLLSLGVIIGVPWIGYIAVTWLITACKYAVVSIASAVWEMVAIIAVDTWRVLRGIGPQLSKLFEKLVSWIEKMLRE